MRYLATITMLVLALAMVQPVAAQSFKPDYDAGLKAYDRTDYAMALRHWRALAEQGHADAQNELGWLYSQGLGVTRDRKEGFRWYRKAAKQGHAKAQRNLASLEKKLRRCGNWPPRSRQAKANPAFTPDYNAGYAAYNCGDYATALKHSRPLAEQGVARAQHNLVLDCGGLERQLKIMRLPTTGLAAACKSNAPLLFQSLATILCRFV